MQQLEVRGLSKVYLGSRGLLPVSFSVKQGEFVGIVGHNGAGKSTLLKLLASWIRPDAGDVLVEGVSLADRIRSVGRVGFVPESPNLFEMFTVEYNFQLFAKLFGVARTRVDQIVLDFDLTQFRRTKVHALSKGLKQRVSLGRCLLAQPNVLLFDEPTTGLDFEMTKELYHRLKNLHTAGKTVLFTSHHPEEIKMLATRIIVIHAGQIFYDGEPSGYFDSMAHKELFQ